MTAWPGRIRRAATSAASRATPPPTATTSAEPLMMASPTAPSPAMTRNGTRLTTRSSARSERVGVRFVSTARLRIGGKLETRCTVQPCRHGGERQGAAERGDQPGRQECLQLAGCPAEPDTNQERGIEQE